MSSVTLDKEQFEAVLNRLDKITDLLALNMVRDCEKQKDKILILSSFGFGVTEIARLLRTTSGTVNQALVRSRKEKNAKTEKTVKESSENPANGGVVST